MSEILLKDGWLFHKENEPAEVVTIPHTYNAKDGQSGTCMWRGRGFYERELNITEEELSQYLYLEIGAASLVSTVFVNQKEVYKNSCPYSMYRVPLNCYLKPGLNHIEIVTDNSVNDAIYPQMADFSFYGGLYREVKLLCVSEIHLDYMDGSREGVLVKTKKITDELWEVCAEGCVVNETEPCHGSVILSLWDEGTLVTQISTDMEFGEKNRFQLVLPVEKPHLWMGTEDPHLYKAQIEIHTKDRVKDSQKIAVGFRTINVTPDKGLFLNNKHVKLHGVARHQDFGGTGSAVTRKEMECDIQLIKELGANSVRLSHYQHDDYFYRRCDEEGILVWAEVPYISIVSENEEAETNIREQMRRLIYQCGNHTSVYCWGVQNEITIAGETEEIYENVRRMTEYTKALDPERYTAEANIYSVPNESPMNQITELVGYNLYYGWYYDEIEGLQKRLDEFHAACPKVPLLVTEYGVDTNPQYHSYEPKVKDYTEEYQLIFSDNALRNFEEREYFVGSYVWNMADFGSAARDEGGKQGQNQKGLVTIDRKLKKDAFYLYKAYWSKEPFVKLAGSRFVNRHREENTITVLSNLSRLELFVNGQLTAKTEQVKPKMDFFHICLKMGMNTISVKGYDKDGTVYEDTMELNRVESEDVTYHYVKKDEGGVVINWFEKFDLADAVEIELDESCYSSSDKIKVLLENPETEKIIKKYFGELLSNPRFSMLNTMTVDAMAKIRNLGMPPEMVAAINQELNQIKK